MKNIVPRECVAALLDRECADPKLSASTEAEPDLLNLEILGVGAVRLPVTPSQVRKLRNLGTPARFGRGTETLTDISVRDTWEVPKDTVALRFGDGLPALLDALRAELGLPSSCTLRPELHSMLVYGRGQFFLPHQDSEKHNAMIGTLVVTLPSRHTGGELVIGRGEATAEYRGSASNLVLTAFYADCRHEVRPVKSGHRIALTFNLLLDGASTPPPDPSAATVTELARHLREHFSAPVRRIFSRGPATPPSRLVYLLDHEYTERGLSWARLKGGDATKASLLRAAAETADCRVMLALGEIQETWDAYPTDEEDDWYDGPYDDEDNENDDDDDPDTADDTDCSYQLNDLVESATRLAHWTDPDTGYTEQITLEVDETELCAGTTNSALTPYEQQYEGFMGNYGNTLDRWYRRAALVLFPAAREFANRAESSPAWALTHIDERARTGDLAGAQADAADLAPFWAASISENPQPEALVRALHTAHALDDPTTANLLLSPFRAEQLSASAGTPLACLAEQHDADWIATLLRGWFSSDATRAFEYAHTSCSQELEWYAAVPDLCTALHGGTADGAAQLLTDLAWKRLHSRADGLSALAAPSRRLAALIELGAPLAFLLTAVEAQGPENLTRQITRRLSSSDEDTTVWARSALHAAEALPGHGRGGSAFAALAADYGGQLRERLARPARTEDDWSIAAPADCTCELCEVLSAFLLDPFRRVYEWPLAERSRRHIHARIDKYELPVSHQTRRQGRPYTLVLAKQNTLFHSERTARAQDEADLRWLAVTWPDEVTHP
ncbi:2OG-Fe(II) oxygenase [Actinospica durhamensis]|uniref:2OG-Fe(II) oxygenase n=1 Tax=Actinospica durhamensis TaxID=1508375 RepID=A0A941ESA3_9ACTN|nr:2OG-Fe(II) oxygenase [Actinospica durhamensis]MBR7836258.1 2OG-Fe(II) oxygenase [Actinospica durhamensis]